MPPRLPTLQRLGSSSLCLRPAAKPSTPNFLPITQTANLSQQEKKRLAKQDPYRFAQAEQRKNANLKRREELKRERDATLGDPIWGKVTPFVESLDSAGQAAESEVRKDAEGNPIEESHKLPTTPGLRNHFLTDAELSDAIKHAYSLTKPGASTTHPLLPSALEGESEKHEAQHANALEALRRITSMQNSSGKDRFHANVRRIVDEFGRHKTDKFLAQKPESIRPNEIKMPGRAGPDTGSSEVQIAILTAKIRSVAKGLQINRGHKDKHNRRNLRLLLHRRQKLIKYMARKERGSGRWTHMIEKLGLTPATWQGQIEL